MFFKLESNGFVICLGIILLLTGLIMFYVKQRFSVYDKIISEQNKLLKHVVASIEYSSIGGMQSANGLSNSIALQTAREVSLRNKSEINDQSSRISVSDDESSEEIESKSDEEESECEDSSENDEDSVEDEPEYKNNNHSQTKILKISNLDYLTDLRDGSSSSSIDNIDSDDDDEDESEESSQEESMNETKKLNMSEHFIKVIELPSVSDINNIDEESGFKIETGTNKESELLTTKLNVEEVHEDVKHSISKKIDLANNLASSTLNGLKKTELEAMCKDKNLNTKGTRLELIKRLSEL